MEVLTMDETRVARLSYPNVADAIRQHLSHGRLLSETLPCSDREGVCATETNGKSANSDLFIRIQLCARKSPATTGSELRPTEHPISASSRRPNQRHQGQQGAKLPAQSQYAVVSSAISPFVPTRSVPYAQAPANPPAAVGCGRDKHRAVVLDSGCSCPPAHTIDYGNVSTTNELGDITYQRPV